MIIFIILENLVDMGTDAWHYTFSEFFPYSLSDSDMDSLIHIPVPFVYVYMPWCDSFPCCYI